MQLTDPSTEYVGYVGIAGVEPARDGRAHARLHAIGESIRHDLEASGAGTIRSLGFSLLATLPDEAAVAAFATLYFTAIERYADRATLRCALALAWVVHDGAPIVDEAVISASRLCYRAKPGQVLLDAAAGASLCRAGGVALRELTRGRHGAAAIWELLRADDGVGPPAVPGGGSASIAREATARRPAEYRSAQTITQWEGSTSELDLDLSDGEPAAWEGSARSVPGESASPTSLVPRPRDDTNASVTLIHGGRIVTVLPRTGALAIGRRPVAAPGLRVAAPGVSARHCWVEARDGRYWVVDKSTNGTLLLGDSGRVARVHFGEQPIADESGWLVLGRSAAAPRVRYHVLQRLGLDAIPNTAEPDFSLR